MIYEFAATQDLHGYDKPWSPGEGPNKFDLSAVENGIIDDANGVFIPRANNSKASDYIPVTEGESYRIVTEQTIGEWGAWYDEEKTYISGITHFVINPVVTAPAGAYYCRFTVVYNGNGNIDTFAFNSPSTVTVWSPYSNVCMPEGFNIWDPTNAEYVQVYAGYVNANTRELYLRPWYTEYAGEELVGPWMSSLDEYSEDATPTEGAFVIDFGGELTSYEITPFMLQTLLESLGIRQHFTDGAGLLNSLMDQAQGRVRSEEELLHLSRPLKVIAIGDQLPAGLKIRPISKDVLPGLPGKFIR